MAEIEPHPDWIDPNASLLGVNGNAFAVMGHTRRELKKAGNSPGVLDAYKAEAMSGDYDHLLQTSMVYCGMA